MESLGTNHKEKLEIKNSNRIDIECYIIQTVSYSAKDIWIQVIVFITTKDKS